MSSECNESAAASDFSRVRHLSTCNESLYFWGRFAKDVGSSEKLVRQGTIVWK